MHKGDDDGIIKIIIVIIDRDISVGIETGYGLHGPAIESRWGRDFPPDYTCPGAHPAACKMGTGSLFREKSGLGVALTTHHTGVVWLDNSFSSVLIKAPASSIGL